MENELVITPPEGYVIDKENSTFERIVFKRDEHLTYGDVANELFGNKYWFADSYGNVMSSYNTPRRSDPNNCTSERQVEKLLAFNKLMNVAKYLNKGWKPNWDDSLEMKWTIRLINDEIVPYYLINCNETFLYFKTEKFVKQAIEILGEDTIRLALSTDW